MGGKRTLEGRLPNGSYSPIADGPFMNRRLKKQNVRNHQIAGITLPL
jgi:hypothetical protein